VIMELAFVALSSRSRPVILTAAARLWRLAVEGTCHHECLIETVANLTLTKPPPF
jgi:hypothetical protein